MNMYRYEVLLQRIELVRMSDSTAEPHVQWTVQQLNLPEIAKERIVLASGYLHARSDRAYAQVLVSGVVSANEGGHIPADETDQRVLLTSLGCVETMYDVARRCINSQAAHMDAAFSLDLKAPETEVLPPKEYGDD